MLSRRHTPVAALAVVLMTGPASAPNRAYAQSSIEVTRRIIEMERDHSEVMSNLEYLSDMIGPRLTGSDRLKRANDWTAEKMKEYGLQNVHLESYTIARGWERGAVEARIVSPSGIAIDAAQMAWTPGTRGRVRGPIVVFSPESEADFAAYRGKLRNAIVIGKPAPSPSPGGMMAWPGSTPLPPVKALAEPAMARPVQPAPAGRNVDFKKVMEFRQKVRQFLHQEGVLAELRDASKPHSLLNMTGSFENMPKPEESFPVLFVAHEHVAMMHRLLQRNEPVTVELKVDCRFTHGPVTVYNTVGDIPGSARPGEVVLLGAHLDSWDLGTGTTDNGTGSMAVLEAARLLKSIGQAPSRTVRFVLFSGEEQGLVGSREYVKAHRSEMDKYNVVFVHDTGTGRVKGAWLQDRAECLPLLEQQFGILNDLGLLTSSPNLIPGKMNGTDHASFDDAGVPAFAFNQEGAEYGLTHHSQSDTFDKAIPEDLKQGACVLAVLAYNAAQMPERYPRKPANGR